MKTIQNSILKNGIKDLAKNNETSFKKSLIDVLSFKLNESLENTENITKNRLLEKKEEITKITSEIKIFLEFLNNYNAETVTKIKLKNDSILNITEENIKNIKALFDQLKPENRQLMAETIFNDTGTFQQHLEFYEKTKAINK
jgi:hypothetical protein